MGTTPAHRRPKDQPKRGWRPWLIGAIAVVVVAGLAAGAGLFLHTPSNRASAAPKPPVLPLNVVSTNPAANATNVPSNTTITVDLSTSVAPNSPMPSLSPAVPGTWSAASATELEFVASGPLVPGTQETLTIPGGPTGLVSPQGRFLASSTTVNFTVAPGSTLRLQQLLAQLGFLPLAFTPTQPASPQQEAEPQPGSFSWRWANQPASLTSLWTQGTSNVITTGAVMSFEDQHGLATDGIAGPQVWTALLQAAAAGQGDTKPYGYVYVTENLPETVTVYQNGAQVYQTLANTGVPAAPTATGTYPVYLRYVSTTMKGTNPNGTPYNDPGIPWVSYFNGGDALHGFIRAQYGFPQSLGCVEMPFASAQVVWPYTPLGTLVTIL